MINYIAYYPQYDGYGRWNSRLVRALQQEGLPIKIATMEHREMPGWMLQQEGLSWNNLTISCLPPYFVKSVPGRQWLITMLEGSVAPEEWVDRINNSNVERVIVPCQHNADAFVRSGLVHPVHVVPGGTDPREFPFFPTFKQDNKPYTFLTLADRGFRKGWQETFYAFYSAFGGKTDGNQDVRLIVKYRPKRSETPMDYMRAAVGADPRIVFQPWDSLDMYDVYSQADCVVLPSRCEGWGMPHREAAMMGIPMITQKYSGMDDGFTERWALVVDEGTIKPIPLEHKPSMGEWRVVNKEALAQVMKWCYYSPETALGFGEKASRWLRENQTWNHSAKRLIELLKEYSDVFQMECSAL